MSSKARFIVYQDESGEWRWALKHDNGRIIADSGQGYASKQKAEQGLDSVRKNAESASVVERPRPGVESPEEGDGDE